MIFYFALRKICSASNKFLYFFLFLLSLLFRLKIKFVAYRTKLRGVARCTAIVAIRQMRGKAGGGLQFASCLNAPSLPARNDRHCNDIKLIIHRIWINGNRARRLKIVHSDRGFRAFQ